MIKLLHKEDCCGCTACQSVCAHGAITMETDEHGVVFPHVREDLCTDCGLCERVCPLLRPPVLGEPLSCSVAMASDAGEQRSSTSGGLMAVCARHVVERQGGVVYGCSAADCHHVRHVRVESVDGLQCLKGSKYVQSDMSGVYPQVKRDLRAGRYVLFTGTPCQVAGLRTYLGKPYDRLFCIDFVCHGVPSQQLLSSAIKELELPAAPSTVRFRAKRLGKSSQYGFWLDDAHGKQLYGRAFGKDAYITGYLYALFYRDSCYACPFARTARSGDLTVGDYWDRDKAYSHMPGAKDGLSQLHVNTPQGRRLLAQVSAQILTAPIALERLLAHSPQLSRPMPRHRHTTLFWQLHARVGFQVACRKALSAEFRHLRWQGVNRVLFALPGFRPLYFGIKKLLIKHLLKK